MQLSPSFIKECNKATCSIASSYCGALARANGCTIVKDGGSHGGKQRYPLLYRTSSRPSSVTASRVRQYLSIRRCIHHWTQVHFLRRLSLRLPRRQNFTPLPRVAKRAPCIVHVCALWHYFFYFFIFLFFLFFFIFFFIFYLFFFIVNKAMYKSRHCRTQ